MIIIVILFNELLALADRKKSFFAKFYVYRLARQERILETSASATRREQEPIHEDAVAVVVGVVGQQAVPLVLLFAGAIPGATQRPAGAAHLLMHGLLKVLGVDHGPDLAVVVRGPERGGHLRAGFARIDSAITAQSELSDIQIQYQRTMLSTYLFVSVFPSAPGNPACLLSLS